MEDSVGALVKTRHFSVAEDLTRDDLKFIKQRMETVGIESSRLLAKWMKETHGLEFSMPAGKGDEPPLSQESKEFQIARSKVIAKVIDRIRKELGPISGVDPMGAKGS